MSSTAGSQSVPPVKTSVDDPITRSLRQRAPASATGSMSTLSKKDHSSASTQERLRKKAAIKKKQDAIYGQLEQARLAETHKKLGGKPMMTGTMKCPEVPPGTIISVSLPDGNTVDVEVPPYAKPGVEFAFGFEAPEEEEGLPDDHDGRFLEKELEVPSTGKAGDVMCVLALPWKQDLEIKIPEGLKPGAKFTVKVPVPKGFGKERIFQHTIQVPRGISPGEKCDFTLPWGEKLGLTVPEGATEGDNLQIEVPFPPDWTPPPVAPSRKVEQTITIPEGCAAGEKIILTLPWGASHEITVPEGASAGDELKVVLDQPGSFTQEISFGAPVEVEEVVEETKA